MGRTSDTREKLLQAALDLIWSSSFGSVSVDQICERAQVKKGSFYHFFPSKTDLAVAAYEEAWRNHAEPFFASVFRPDVPGLQRITRWCEEIYRLQKESYAATGHVPGCPFSSIASEMATQDERLRRTAEEILEREHAHFERALRDAIDAGAIRPGDPAAIARMLGTFLLGATLQAKVHNDPELLRSLGTQACELLGATVPA